MLLFQKSHTHNLIVTSFYNSLTGKFNRVTCTWVNTSNLNIFKKFWNIDIDSFYMPCCFRMWVMTALHCFSFLCSKIFAFITPLLLYSFSQMGFIAVFYPLLLCSVSIKFSKAPFLITSPKSLCCLFLRVSNCFFVISVLHKSSKKISCVI